jgi:ubiquinone biosynthesis protein
MIFQRQQKPRLRKLARYRQIITKLVTYGFQDVVGRLRLPARLISRLSGRQRSRVAGKAFSERIRLLFEDLGPTFVKLGQLMSLRSDLFPDDLTDELRKLQHAVAPFPGDEAVKIIQEELHVSLDKVFKSFDHEPFASASIAQVHRAVTFTGRTVAVKIQRPGIKHIIDTDLAILQDLAELAEKYLPSLRFYKPSEIISQFKRVLELELDFDHEGRTMGLFRSSFQDDQTVCIPMVYWDFTTRRILTMDYIDGIRLTEIDRLEKEKLDRKTVAVNGSRFVLKQIFKHGFFQADPHPGNFLILENNVIAAVDFGQVGYIDTEMKNALGVALNAFLNKDPNKLIRLFVSMDFIEDESDHSTLRRDLFNLFNYYYNLPLAQLNMAKMIGHLNLIIRDNHVALPAEMALTFKALITVESLGKELDPDFNFVSEARPFLHRLALDRITSWNNVDRAADLITDLGKLILELPGDVGSIVKKARSGRLKFKLEHGNLENVTRTIHKSVNRLAFSIVIAGMLVGSSLMMQVKGYPTILGLPIIALAGYFISGFLGLWLIIGIIRSRGL